MGDWSTAPSLATALGTLVLALATFVVVRAANRAARVAEYPMEIGIRPLLMPSRLEDTVQKIMWGRRAFGVGSRRKVGVCDLAAAPAPVVRSSRVFAIELLYSDHEGGQRAIGRFAVAPLSDA
jgi:hypothetical protein